MKNVLFILSFFAFSLNGIGQTKITAEQARSICAQQMAAFTKAVAPSYQKGQTYEQFRFTLMGKAQPTVEGANQLKAAYNFLLQGVSNEFIITNYKGLEIARSMKYLSDLHDKGIDSDGSELFGGKTGAENSFAKSGDGGCKWYQFWCLMQEVANWVVNNWQTISQIIIIIIQVLP